MTHWRRHRMFNFGRGVAVLVAFGGVIVMAGAAGTSDLNLSSLEQLILTLCFGIAVIAVGITGFCVLQAWERSLKDKERRARKNGRGQKNGSREGTAGNSIGA